MATISLTTVAVVGTAQSGGAQPETGTPVDQLGGAKASAERELLLRAGARAVYRMAGYLPDASMQAPTAAPAETRPLCSPAVASLVESMLIGKGADVLPDALERLGKAGYRLPPSLLSLALTNTHRPNRAAMAPLLGERGRWLSQFNSAWRWANETLGDDGEDLPLDAETIWQEGTVGRRVEVLRRLRQHDPARAREWLADVWKREKAEARDSMLETFEVGLCAEDEGLLVTALKDRSESVRQTAALLLNRLPTSALTARMRQRGEAMLAYAKGALDANPPTAVDAEWARDGLVEKVAQGKGARTFWLSQVLERISPTHWEATFGLTPEELVAATAKSKWRITILEAWTGAAVKFEQAPWAPPLWRFWLNASSKEIKQANDDRSSLCEALAPLLPAAEVEEFALALIQDVKAHEGLTLDEALALLPRPWSATLADAYLDGLRAFASSLTAQSKLAEPWDDSLDNAALALPATHFAQALAPIEVPESKYWQIGYFRDQLGEMAETIRLRERITKEIPL